MINLEIKGLPKPKQSARFRIGKNKAGKNFIRSYQKKEVVEEEANLGFTVIQQLPADFVPYDCPIAMEIEYVFPIPKSFSKKQMQSVLTGKVYKSTRPDIGDNLNKGVLDALNGIVYIDDARIAYIKAQKYYGNTPKTLIKVYKLEE